MSSDFEIRGAQEFYRFSKALKAAGETGKGSLRDELHKGMKAAAKPLIAKARAEARATLPTKGGLADKVAKAPQRVQVRTGEKNAGVSIVVGKKGSGARAANAGSVRHPVFGTDKFVTQRVRPGWFDRPMQAGAPIVRPEMEAAIERVAQQVVDRARRG